MRPHTFVSATAPTQHEGFRGAAPGTPPRRRLAGRYAVLLLLGAAPAGCRTWRAEPLPAAGAPARVVQGRVRATRADGSRVELVGARVGGDTLRGARGGTEVAVPLDSVRRLEARRVSALRTGALVGGVLLTFAAAIAAAFAAAGPGLPSY